MPGSGDSIQALKAGIMEIPDIIVINKADHPLTETMVREIRGVLSLAPATGGWPVPIVKTEAVRAEGVEELVEQLDKHHAHIEAEGRSASARRRNLRTEVLGLHRPPAPPARGALAGPRTRRFARGLLDEVARERGSTRRAPRPGPSSRRFDP